jgi:heme A synthase
MDLVVIAQILTGIATLIVAFVLLYQLRHPHKDAGCQEVYLF